MAAVNKDEVKEKEIPDIVVDPTSGKKYLKGRFLGKGGFAKCYELTEIGTSRIVAGKVVPKTLLVKPHQREKITQEISIHRTLGHKHVVGFFGYFEDEDFVYILLELCRRRSLMELHKRRRAVTEPEARYFVHQIILACSYLHKNNIIHRDLKLGNIFLNDEMEVKIGDFGLATRLDYVGERKRTLCGTPNYIAPEILGKKGHSYEVDAWSLGCIVYTLLVGKPPFETASLRDTYSKIRHNDYIIPQNISTPARNLIARLLQSDPSSRPNMLQVSEDEFFTSGVLPAGLPTSCLTMAPRSDMLKHVEYRKPLLALNEEENIKEKPLSSLVKQATITRTDQPASALVNKPEDNEFPADNYISDLVTLLTSVTQAKPSEKPKICVDEALDPAALPIYWVGKWVDYSDKYGLGYQLCDNSVGVLYNDSTRLLLTSNAEIMQYIERDGTEHFHTLRVFPETLTKKVTLLKYFRNYMSEHLVRAGDSLAPREGEELTRLPFLRTWFRTRSAIILHLSNGTLQINFFQDHTKIILCPLMSAVTYIDDKKDVYTYRLAKIEEFGCSPELASRLRYALTMAERLYAAKSSSAKSTKAA